MQAMNIEALISTAAAQPKFTDAAPGTTGELPDNAEQLPARGPNPNRLAQRRPTDNPPAQANTAQQPSGESLSPCRPAADRKRRAKVPYPANPTARRRLHRRMTLRRRRPPPTTRQRVRKTTATAASKPPVTDRRGRTPTSRPTRRRKTARTRPSRMRRRSWTSMPARWQPRRPTEARMLHPPPMRIRHRPCPARRRVNRRPAFQPWRQRQWPAGQRSMPKPRPHKAKFCVAGRRGLGRSDGHRAGINRGYRRQ